MIRAMCRWRFVATCIALLPANFVLSAAGEDLSRYEATEKAMGAAFEIALYAPDDQTAAKALDAAFARIHALDKALSDYDPQSELSRLSAAAPTSEPVRVSDDLWNVLVESQKISAASGGAFDVTVGPLTTLWRQSRQTKTLPSAAKLKQAQAAVGYQHLKLIDSSKSVELLRPKMRLDLGSIAKGLAGDEALKVLREHGISRALVNGGGGMTLGDPPPGKAGWRVGVAPLEPQSPPSTFLLLANCGIATAGDAWQFVEIDGKRYSHIVDPKTGLGLTERISVTVIAPSGLLADGWDTPMCVLGPRAGLKLIQSQPNCETLIVYLEDGQPQTLRTPGFDKIPRAE
jgi:thiamine biosynthesis lipoprotein